MRIKKINKKKGIFFRISGLPGSGKTRIALKLLPMIKKKFGPTIMWSGDDMRRIFKNRKYDLKSRNQFGEMNVKLASFIKLIVPNIISITSSSEIFLCNPPLNPPSLNASIIKAIIAGPEDVNAKKISRESSGNS